MNGDNLPYQTLDVVPFTPITSEWGDGVGDDILALASGAGFDDDLALPANTVDTPEIKDKAVTSAKLADDFLKGRFQANTTDSVVTGLALQAGWGFIQGNGSTTLNETVTFPTAFSAAPLYVSVSFIAAASTGAGTPDDLSDFTNGFSDLKNTYTQDVTATDFRVDMTGTSNFGSGFYFGYSWIAIGVPA